MTDNNIIIDKKTTLLDALSIMDKSGRKLLIICEGSHFVGLISIGDIQRAILDKRSLDSCAEDFVRSDIIYAIEPYNKKEVQSVMKRERIEFMPIVSKAGELIDVIEWAEIFDEEEPSAKISVSLPVVIMAGGKGTRLKPLTNIIPKPLVPVSDKTIIEEIIDEFAKAGCIDYYISLNYKAEEIQKYITGKRLKHNIEFITEKKTMGTAGSLFLMRERLSGTFFVSNCDILVDVSLADLYDYHRINRNIITLVSVVKKLYIPYGTIETTKNGILDVIHEKPNITYQINSGLYVIEPDIFKYIEGEEELNITDLIMRIKYKGGKIGVFPVSEGSWKDMGNWKSYLKMIDYGDKIE